MRADPDCKHCNDLLIYLFTAMLDGEWANVSGYALDLESHIYEDHREETPAC